MSSENSYLRTDSSAHIANQSATVVPEATVESSHNEGDTSAKPQPQDEMFFDPDQPKGYKKGLSSRPRIILRRLCQAMVDLMNIGIPKISTEELYDLVHTRRAHIMDPQHYLLVDARREEEFAGGHIMGAVNHTPPKNFLMSLKQGLSRIPEEQELNKCSHCPKSLPSNFDGMAEAVDKDSILVVIYDDMGLRGGILTRRLRSQGYKRATVLRGSFYKWVDENKPLCSRPNTGGPGKVVPEHAPGATLVRSEKRTWSPWERLGLRRRK